MDQFILSPNAARRLGISPATLRKWRTQQRGPSYLRLGDARKGRVLYAVSDIKRWLEQQTKVGGDMTKAPTDTRG